MQSYKRKYDMFKEDDDKFLTNQINQNSNVESLYTPHSKLYIISGFKPDSKLDFKPDLKPDLKPEIDNLLQIINQLTARIEQLERIVGANPIDDTKKPFMYM